VFSNLDAGPDTDGANRTSQQQRHVGAIDCAIGGTGFFRIARTDVGYKESVLRQRYYAVSDHGVWLFPFATTPATDPCHRDGGVGWAVSGRQKAVGRRR